jgi:iron complex outermembrane receptor protein
VLQGIDFSSALKLGKYVDWVSKYSILRAKDVTTKDWLIRMPSDRITNEITYNFSGGKTFTKTYVSFELQNVFTQTRVPDEKNGKQDYKDAPDGYTLLNADFSTVVTLMKLPVTLSLSGRNLLNTSYREYLNSMRYFTDEQGRNIGIRLKIPLEHLY